MISRCTKRATRKISIVTYRYGYIIIIYKWRTHARARAITADDIVVMIRNSRLCGLLLARRARCATTVATDRRPVILFYDIVFNYRNECINVKYNALGGPTETITISYCSTGIRKKKNYFRPPSSLNYNNNCAI